MPFAVGDVVKCTKLVHFFAVTYVPGMFFIVNEEGLSGLNDKADCFVLEMPPLQKVESFGGSLCMNEDRPIEDVRAFLDVKSESPIFVKICHPDEGTQLIISFMLDEDLATAIARINNQALWEYELKLKLKLTFWREMNA